MKLTLQTKITNDSILVASEECQTIFIQNSMPPLLSVREFKLNLKQLKADCKQNKTRLYQAGAKAFVENYPAYVAEWWRLSGLFAQLREVALKIEREGLTAPTVDSERLKEARPLNNEFEKGFWRSAIASKMRETFLFVESMSKKDLGNFSMVKITY